MGEARFWLAEEGQAHAALVTKGRRIHEADARRREALRYYLCLYEEILFDETISDRSVYRSSRRPVQRHMRRDLNLAKSIVDTAYSEAVQSATRVSYVTDGGSWKLQRTAEKREQFTNGEFRRMKWQALKAKMILHAGIFGTGIGKVFRDGTRVSCALVHPWNLYVDDADGSHGEPRAMYERALVDRYVLIGRYPEHKRAILDAPAARIDGYTPADQNDDRVEVWEGVRLPSSEGMGDGRHVIGCVGATLHDEPWEHEYFPYLVLYWREPVVGFWGYGICEILGTVQETISRAERQIEAAHWAHGHARLWAPKGTVNALQISNQPGTFNEYAGNVPPSLLAGNILSPEIYSDRQSQIEFAYTLTGVSQYSAQNIKPAGIDSGKALRMFNELQSKPILPFLKACEQLDVEAARRTLDVAKAIYDETGEYRSKAVRREGLAAVDFGDIGDADDFEIEAFPVSALSRTPGGRMADVQDLIQSGMAAAVGWEPAELLDLMDIPDLRAQSDLVKGPLMLIRSRIEDILDGGEPVSPTNGINTKLAKKLCVLYLQKAETMRDVDNISKDNLRLWYAAVVELERQEQAASASLAPTPAPGQPGPDMGAGPVDPAAMMAAQSGVMPGAGMPLDMPAPGSLVNGMPQGQGAT